MSSSCDVLDYLTVVLVYVVVAAKDKLVFRSILPRPSYPLSDYNCVARKRRDRAIASVQEDHRAILGRGLD